MGHNTQLPTCGMLSGKLCGKWQVERHATLRGRGTSEPVAEYTWCAFHSEHDIEETHRHFPTWRDALAYADRMARTREVVLPRLAPQGEVTVSAVWEYDRLTVHYYDASGEIVQGTPADLARHAAALLTLAE